VVPATLQQPIPFAVEVKRGDLRNGHGPQFGIEVRRLIVVALDGLGCQCSVNMLGEELLQEHAERSWGLGHDIGTRLCHVSLLLLFDPPNRLGVLGRAFGCKAGPCDP